MTLRRFSTSNITTGTKSHKMWDGETFPGYFESIATIVVGSSGAANIEFTSIPQNYTHLQLRIYWGYSNTANNTWLNTIFNSDSGSNYASHALRGDGSSIFSSNVSNYTYLSLGADQLGDASFWGVSVADILDYSNTTKFKTTRALSGQDRNGGCGMGLWSGLWRSTAAITSIRISPDTSTFRAGSNFALYGIRTA